jgi:hypothetical protein
VLRLEIVKRSDDPKGFVVGRVGDGDRARFP